MTEESRSGDHEDSGADGRGEGRSGGPDGRGRGERPRSRSGNRGSRDHRGGRQASSQRGRRDDRGGRRGRDDRGGGPRGDRRAGSRDDRRGGGRGRDDRRGGGGFRRDDQRRNDRDRRPREERDPADAAPLLPEEATFGQLDPELKRDLNSLPKSLAELVGKHVVAAGLLLEENPERAYKHALFARRKASRVPGVREASGVAAYAVGKWQEALADLRAARRMSGRDSFLAVMADCERGLGRPERALEVAGDPAAKDLDPAERIELRIVASGARRDMGDPKAALAELKVPELKERRARPWIARLFYAYADVLAELGRTDDAREYFARASSVDREGVTEADERLAELEGVELVDVDLEDGIMWSDAEDPASEVDEHISSDGPEHPPEKQDQDRGRN
ncbi:tetratricopeptide repeat protein [Nocardiopsis kunsanensis]|uniref:tetratricopeptide repeat protein n=1 Tax=Nocardiopsis kunsanensis TaxID=141693 RepID=UPI0003460C40|nr:hypothetical protein [Nocardiopsis kunsanensis]